MVAITRLVKFC